MRKPKHAPPNLDRLRTALIERAGQWKTDLRADPTASRLLPLTLWNAAEPSQAWIEWAASLTPGLLDGLDTSWYVPNGTRGEWVFWAFSKPAERQ